MNKLSLVLLVSILIFGCQEKKDPLRSGAFGALDLMTQMRAYPNEDIPKEGYYQAYRESKATLPAQTNARVEPWEGIGPHNIAGRALCTAINPQNNKTIYLGTASGGLWRSYNQGLGVSWEQVSTGYPLLGVGAIEFAPGDSSVMYIATGEVYNVAEAGNGAAYRPTRGTYGMGILKSTDGGATWAPSLDWTYEQQRGVWQVKVAPSDPKIVYAGTTHGTYKSIDAGGAWTQINSTVMVMDLVVHPTNPDIVFIGCGNLFSNDHGIYRTQDGGTSWTKAGAPLPGVFGGKIMLDMHEANPQILYASIGNSLSSGNSASWLCKTENGGDSWNVVNTEDYSLWQGWFSHDVAIHPDDPDEIMVIGITIWKSENGGVTLTEKTFGGVAFGQPPIGEPDGAPNFTHSDHHDVLYDPSDPNIIYFANDGGLYGSFDGGETFRSLNGGLQTAQFYNGVSVAQTQSGFFMGGLQDNSTVVYNNDLAWTRVIGGDGSWTAWNTQDENIYFGSSQRLNIARTLNGGAGFNTVTPPQSPSDETVFIAPYVLAPSSPETIYAGRSSIYVSFTNGSNWFAGNGELPLNGDPIFAMDVAAQNPQIVYVATAPLNDRARIFYSDDFASSFSDITGGLPDRFINDIHVDPNNNQTAYVTMGGFGTGHVFKTENAGANWFDITGDLPDVPTSAVAVDPDHSPHIYVGNDLGVYFSPDGGTTWEDYNEGITEGCLVMDLKIQNDDRLLYVGTHGKGAYFRDLEVIDVATESIDFVNNFSIFPNPFQEQFQIELEALKNETINIDLFNMTGQLIKRVKNNLPLLAGKNTIRIQDLSTLPIGNYVIKIDAGANSISRVVQKIE